MKRFATAFLLATTTLAAIPGVALAQDATPTSPVLRIGMSAVGLLVAILLLLEALRVKKVAFGGAIAERMSYVVLAILCLAGSALARWVGNFVTDVNQEQVQLASEALVIAAMALLATYFYSVRSALQKYLKAMTGSEMLASSPRTDEDEED